MPDSSSSPAAYAFAGGMKRTLPVAIAAVLMLGGCAATSATAEASGSSRSIVAADPVLNLTPGGSFADQPDLAGGPMTIDQAVADAISRSETEDPQTEVEVISYQEFNDTTMNGSASQLAPESSVIVVHVLAPFPAAALPGGAPLPDEELSGEEPDVEPRADWPTYVVAFDPRTGLALSVSPGGAL